MDDVLFYSIGVYHPISPSEPLPSLPEIPRGSLSSSCIGRPGTHLAYGFAFHQLHGSPAGAIAVFDPRLGVVIVASHHPRWRKGKSWMSLHRLTAESRVSTECFFTLPRTIEILLLILLLLLLLILFLILIFILILLPFPISFLPCPSDGFSLASQDPKPEKE